MKIIGCDFHPSYQQIAWCDTDTGETGEARLTHSNGQAEQFYRSLGRPVRVGMETVGNAQWFERLLGELKHELWIGDAAQIRSLVVRRQKTDRRDAQHLLDLLLSDRFPRIWVPSPEVRDARQLLLHRHKLVRMRVAVKNQLQHLALNQGVQCKRKLWTREGRRALEELSLTGWTATRRQDLLQLLDQLNTRIAQLDGEVWQMAAAHPTARLLQTHPGIGPVVSLAFVLTLGPWQRFAKAKRVVSYLGLNQREYSSGGRQKLGRISKQGNVFLRSMLVEASLTAARRDPQLRRAYRRLAARKHKALARVMVARKLAMRLYWMLRENRPYRPIAPRPVVAMPESPSHPVVAR